MKTPANTRATAVPAPLGAPSSLATTPCLAGSKAVGLGTFGVRGGDAPGTISHPCLQGRVLVLAQQDRAPGVAASCWVSSKQGAGFRSPAEHPWAEQCPAPSWRLFPSAQTATSFHASQISHYFDFPSSLVMVAPSFWSHCAAPEAVCFVSHPERSPVLAFPAPPFHVPPSQPLSLCQSPPAFAHLHTSWHWH